MSTAIEFNNISKQYRLGLVSTKTLSADLNRWWAMNVRGKEDPYLKIGSVNDRSSAADSEYVWALRDIDFKVEQGDVVGIIGKNGAGKSTLLKLLSKVTAPTTGTIKARGRIGALLEVGTGFHPEMTGRENIYMNGAIMGMNKQEISRKLDEIVDFSGCERYIDTPVKRYSSGMTVRLGFAVAAHLDPEILVVDEVLAVGDAEFQKKAIGKMQDVSKGEGRTVLFVSHNMDSIQKLCTRGVLLRNGMIDYMGDIKSTIAKYQQINELSFGPQWVNQGRVFDGLEIYNMALTDKHGELFTRAVEYNDEVYVEIDFAIKHRLSDITIGFNLFDDTGKNIYRSLSTDVNVNLLNEAKTGHNLLRAKLNTDILLSGRYNVVLDASYHNKGWIVNPYTETECVVSFMKDQGKVFSTMYSTNGSVAPVIDWRLE